MSHSDICTDDVVVIGGGVSGLSIAALLAMQEVPVTVLEASGIGFEASTRNQGWLHSGAWFAPRQLALAERCWQSFRKTVHFCPDCLEPGHTGTLYLVPEGSEDAQIWTAAWDKVGIPWAEVTREKTLQALPGLAQGKVSMSFRLPDRSFQPTVLLKKLVDLSIAHGARIHTNSRVTQIERNDEQVTAVVTSNGDRIKASFVVIATNASQADLSRYLVGDGACGQSLYERVTLQAHLTSCTPQICAQPFCMMDERGLNHMPHAQNLSNRVSVFGNNHWKVVTALESHCPSEDESRRIRNQVCELFPNTKTGDMKDWSGTTVQAMHIDQIDPGQIPLPTIIDHAHESPCVPNLISVYPGRATLWPQLASDAAEIIMARTKRLVVTAVQSPWAE